MFQVLNMDYSICRVDKRLRDSGTDARCLAGGLFTAHLRTLIWQSLVVCLFVILWSTVLDRGYMFMRQSMEALGKMFTLSR